MLEDQWHPVLTASSSCAGSQQAPPSAAFQDMVTLVHQQLTHNVYTFIFDATNQDEEEDQNRPPNAEKKARKTKKEGKQVSLVVKAVEEWEISLIKLSRSCKSLWTGCCSCYLHTIFSIFFLPRANSSCAWSS